MAEESVSPAGSTSPELSPEEEWQKIRESYEAARVATKAGDTFCLISSRWWEKWREFTSNKKTNTNEGSSPDHQDLNSTSTPIRPSSIDNSDLINESASVNSTTGIELRDYLQEGAQYILLPEATWNALHSWYRGGPRLSREVISCGEALYVEVYPLRLYLHLMQKADKCTIRISKKEKIGALQKKACEIFQLNSEKVSVWDYFSHRKHALMNDLDKTLNDANIQTDQDILVEVNDDGDNTSDAQENGFTKNHTSALLEPSGSKVQSAPSGVKEAEDHKTPVSVGVSTRGSSVGLTGLLNFGNTCFMNSAIQCLVHTPEFAKYFREDYYKEINRNNPLGMVGELAVAFGDLLRKLWAPGRTPFAPKQFKAKLARFAPQFSGYSQHDSQELLAFLLDGLHEDLNRVKHKPYIKSRDADGRPDEEVADEYWANHIARNNSIIVDVCQGQYKSTLVCPVCEKISVTFDPFMYLSLPFQSTTTRTMTVTVFSCDGSSVPVTCTVNVPKQGCCRDLVKAVASACGLKQNEKVFLAEIQDHLIHRFLEDPLMSLSSIKDDYHLSAYKIPKSMKNTKFLQLIHRRQELEPDNAQGTTGWKAYGTPLVFPVSSDATITRGDLQLIVHTMLSPMLKTDTSSVASGLMNESFEPGSACKESNGPNCPQLKLPLKMVDGNHACIDLSVGEERTVRLPAASLSVLLFIDWSPKLLQKYETHYLERLPEVFKHGSSKKARTEPLSLYTCLEGFLREEPLVPEDMWFCPQCKERRQASKKLDLWRLPEVLVIHLKRFSYSRSMNKLETFVNFPIHDFDLTNYIANKNNSGPQAYDLYALINHYGGMGSGHYTAHIKLIEENRWYSFDDNHITLISEDEVKSNAAYVLFYRRKRSD